MKKLIGVFICLIGMSSIYTQVYEVKWGQSFRDESRLHSGYKFIEIGEDSYWVLQETKDENTIVQYDLNHKLISVKALAFRTSYEDLLLQDIIHTSKGNFLLLHHFDYGREMWRMLASRFVKGQFTDPVVIYEERQKLKKSDLRRLFEQFENGQSDPPVLSVDSSHVALINVLPGEDYKEDEYITVAVWDAEMKPLWNSYHFYKFSRKDFGLTQTAVNNFGQAFIVGWTHKEREGANHGAHSLAYLPEFEYKLFEIRHEAIVEDIVNIGDNVAPLDVALFFPDPDKKEFLLTGFYTDDNHKTRQKGMFFATGHPEAGILSHKLTEFQPRFLAQLISESDISKGKGLDLSFNINELVRFENGNLGFIAEKNYVTYRSTYDYYSPYYGYNNYYYNNYYGRNTRREPVFHSQEIIMPVFDSEGEILKIQVIDKDFSSSTDVNSSYTFARTNGKIYLLFNNRKSKEERKEINKKGSRFTDIVVIDKNGDIETRQTLFSDKEIDLEFVTRQSLYNNKWMLISSESSRKYAFGILGIRN